MCMVWGGLFKISFVHFLYDKGVECDKGGLLCRVYISQVIFYFQIVRMKEEDMLGGEKLTEQNSFTLTALPWASWIGSTEW